MPAWQDAQIERFTLGVFEAHLGFSGVACSIDIEGVKAIDTDAAVRWAKDLELFLIADDQPAPIFSRFECHRLIALDGFAAGEFLTGNQFICGGGEAFSGDQIPIGR